MDQVWKLLAELPQGSGTTDDVARQHVVDILGKYDPAPDCLDRIGTAVAEAVRRALSNTAGEMLCIRIYVSGVKRANPDQKQGWGFYVVEKPAGRKESSTIVELFLFAEGDA